LAACPRNFTARLAEIQLVAQHVYLALPDPGRVMVGQVRHDYAALGYEGLHGVPADPEGLEVPGAVAAAVGD
jgi:hypothetical protein